MRNAFADEIFKLAGEIPELVLLSGDIGNKMFDRFKEHYADRFYNCGVAEANMMGVAAGLALSGLRPVIYTITPFTTFRCFEQIRIDACYHQLPIIFIGVGAGLGYATLGPTHHSCEDIGVLRTLPYLSIVCPADAQEVRGALRQAVRHHQALFLRLGKKGEPVIHPAIPPFTIGKVIPLREGSDVCIMGTGNIVPMALKTAELLQERGVSASVISCHTVKPLDTEFLHQAAAKFLLLVTLEEHSLIGGLGSAIAEWIADQGIQIKLLRLGTADEFLHMTADQEYAREYFGLTPWVISTKIEQIIRLTVNNETNHRH